MRLIAGSGRSGTTWVQDALAAANGLRPVFEPLHPAVSGIGARYAYRALSPDDNHPELKEFFASVCLRRRHAMWTVYRGRPDLLFPSPTVLMTRDGAGRVYRRWKKFLGDRPELKRAGQRSDPLVKCIRANLMLEWLSRHLNCRTVLLVRHPGAVVESQLRLGAIWDPEPVLRRYRNDHLLHELTNNRYRAILGRQLDRVEALTVNWVIENQGAIERAPANGITVVFYERLKAAPDSEWRRMCQALDLPNVPASSARARPSQQSSASRSAWADEVSNEPSWRRGLSRKQVELVQGILDQAQFGLYSSSDPEPRDTLVSAVRRSPTAGIAQ